MLSLTRLFNTEYSLPQLCSLVGPDQAAIFGKYECHPTQYFALQQALAYSSTQAVQYCLQCRHLEACVGGFGVLHLLRPIMKSSMSRHLSVIRKSIPQTEANSPMRVDG